MSKSKSSKANKSGAPVQTRVDVMGVLCDVKRVKTAKGKDALVLVPVDAKARIQVGEHAYKPFATGFMVGVVKAEKAEKSDAPAS